ncbi:MAG: UDP-N-acetylmuramate dehydrogenase [Candidatus Gracilibacteria bacterium]|jgi:UDP-N-acetylmuramate dehydrogenase
MNLLENHLLAPYTSLQIGGPADYYLEAKNTDELLEGLAWAGERKMEVFVFGGGTNLIFDDNGFRGLVIRVKSDGVEVKGETVTADAGVSMARLVAVAAEHELTGIEAWNGLPGTVGGAVRGNAGCFGVEVKDVLKEATVYVPEQGVARMSAAEMKFGYRSSLIKLHPEMVILQAVFVLRKGQAAEIKVKMNEIARARIQKQPAGMSSGSFFKNPAPPERSAGKLIEECGLKGFKIGKAQVSPMHGNFLINTGGATAEEMVRLAEAVKKTVAEKTGVELVEEVLIVRHRERGAGAHK